jgi:hypothetical protein
MVWPNAELADHFEKYNSGDKNLSDRQRDFISSNIIAFAVATSFEKGHIITLSQGGIQQQVRTWASYCDAFDLQFEDEGLLAVTTLPEEDEE